MLTALQLERSVQIIESELRWRSLQTTESRLLHLEEHPESIEYEDLDVLLDVPDRMRNIFLTRSAPLRERYREYEQTPEQIAQHFYPFMRQAWPHAGIDKAFAENWHHRLLCSEYEALASGETLRLLINQPPGTTKSLIAGVFFPAWRWAIDPKESFLYGSYSDEIPKVTNRSLLRLLRSRWYQRRWGSKFQLTKSNEKDVVNSAGGWRIGRGVGGGGTGQHPDYVFVDDAQKGVSVSSSQEMKRAALWYANTLASRGILKKARHAIIQQRLATNDLSGVILGEAGTDEDLADITAAYRWKHVCLPMRFKPDSPYRHPGDPRTTSGELLWPALMPQEHVDAIISNMRLAGEPNPEAQLDQHPRLSQSNLFPGIEQRVIDHGNLPRNIQQGRAVRAWDRAGTEGGGDYTVGLLMVELEGWYYILDVQRLRVGFVQRDEVIVQVAERDRRLFSEYRVVNEIMPGPDGKQVHAELARKLNRVGVMLAGQPATKDKPTRATPLAGAFRNGIVQILDKKPWTHDLLTEYSRFPNGAYDDQVDAGAHGFNALRDWQLGKLV